MTKLAKIRSFFLNIFPAKSEKASYFTVSSNRYFADRHL